MPEILMKHLGARFLKADDTQKHALGIELDADDGNRYKYVKANGAIALGDMLVEDMTAGIDNVKTTPATADAVANGCWPNEGGRVAITTLQFFWMLITGDALVKSAGTVVVGATWALIATAGTVDDTAASAANAASAAAGRGGTFLTVASGGFARIRLK